MDPFRPGQRVRQGEREGTVEHYIRAGHMSSGRVVEVRWDGEGVTTFVFLDRGERLEAAVEP